MANSKRASGGLSTTWPLLNKALPRSQYIGRMQTRMHRHPQLLGVRYDAAAPHCKEAAPQSDVRKRGCVNGPFHCCLRSRQSWEGRESAGVCFADVVSGTTFFDFFSSLHVSLLSVLTRARRVRMTRRSSYIKKEQKTEGKKQRRGGAICLRHGRAHTPPRPGSVCPPCTVNAKV